MLEAAFISDLHLHPEIPLITQRFYSLMDWAVENTQRLYILGDFFHAWPGDDGANAWSLDIAAMMKEKVAQGLQIFYMHGNRDFLLGKRFAKQCGMRMVAESSVIRLGKEKVLLSHGDRYCTLDKAHQRFRRLTRNPLFTNLFLCVPYHWRADIVNKVREQSQQNRHVDKAVMDVVTQSMLKHMNRRQVQILIHGHTHKPGVKHYEFAGQQYQQYVLSDWDDIPSVLCYDKSIGFKFDQPVVF